MRKLFACLSVSIMNLGAAAAPQPDCPIEGEVIQWAADYCMAKIGTDDEIAASECIGEQIERDFKNACHAKRHFKQALCSLVIADGSTAGPVERCVDDPTFSGSTVRHRGAGG